MRMGEFTRMPKFGAKEDSGKRTSPPPAPIATFCTIPTFPKAKSRASSSGRPAAPTAVWGENTAFWPFCDRGCQRGGGGGLSPGHTKPPAPARPRGWRRGGAGGRARPHIAPRPSRPRPAAHRHTGVCAQRGGGGGGGRSSRVCSRSDGCTRVRAVPCALVHALARTLSPPPPLPRAHPARAPPAPRAPAPRTPPPGPPSGPAPRPAPSPSPPMGAAPRLAARAPPHRLLSRSNAPAAAARHRSAVPRRSDAPGATWRAAARCAGRLGAAGGGGGASRCGGGGREGVMQRGAGGARDEGAWKNPNAPPGLGGGEGRAAPPESCWKRVEK